MFKRLALVVFLLVPMLGASPMLVASEERAHAGKSCSPAGGHKKPCTSPSATTTPSTSPSPSVTASASSGISVSPVSSPTPSPASSPNVLSGLVGIATSAASDGTRLGKLAQFETQVGREVGVFRLYEDIEADTLTADDVAVAQRVGAVAISMDVPFGSTWASITQGVWDTHLLRWATELTSLAQSGVSLYLIALTHEPENGPTNRGTAAQYVAASRYYVSFMRAQQVPARFVFAPMLYNFGTKMSTWYPGDAYIDVLAPDGYNWYGPTSCDGSKTFAGMFQQVVDAARSRGKLWGVSEFGTTHRPSDPLHQAGWLDAARTFIDGRRGALAYVSYWYNDARCDWTFHRSEAFAAFGGMA